MASRRNAKVNNGNERKRRFREEISSLTKPVCSNHSGNRSTDFALFCSLTFVDVDDEEEDDDEEDAPEEGFVEQTDIHDTTAADIYRAGRVDFPLPGE